MTPRYGDHVLNQANMQAQTVASSARLAAVLVPLVEREADATVLMTTRSSELRQHSGQIAFPGGKVDAGETPCQAALRETQEEIGLNPNNVEPIGYLDPYLTGTGFRILPVVALVTPPFDLLVNHERSARHIRGAARISDAAGKSSTPFARVARHHAAFLCNAVGTSAIFGAPRRESSAVFTRNCISDVARSP